MRALEAEALGGAARRAGLALVSLVVIAACTGSAAMTSPIASSGESSWVVSEVVDGDTLHVTRSGIADTVRLVGINAPEHGECWADEATAALAAIVGTAPVGLERDVSDRDRYGRLLRYVTVSTGADAGGLLIDGGHAIARAYPPDTARDAEYRERQQAAVEGGRGAWARDACGPGPAIGMDPVAIRIEVHPDAAGDDARNLNDEWVRFTNDDAAPLVLDGWMVRDESSSHRYRFEALTLAPRAAVTLRSGCGTDTDTERHWCVTGSAIWNNGGDTVFLLDPVGNVVAQYGYPDGPFATRTP
jgi:micrococcal nuclease